MAEERIPTTETEGKPIELPMLTRQGEGTHTVSLPQGMGEAAVLVGLCSQIDATTKALNQHRRRTRSDIPPKLAESARLVLAMAETNLYAAQDGIKAALSMVEAGEVCHG